MLVLAGGVNWTLVIVALITAIPATIAALIGNSNRRALKTPSGDPLGHVVERTHDLAAVNTLALGAVEPNKVMQEAVRRLNASPESPVHVNGDDLPAPGEQSA